jgi:hypothetical protein
MKRFPLIGAVCVLASMCLVLPRVAAQQADDVPEYVPPARGAPSGRVGGGTRGLNPLPLAALSPSHTGLTISPQPVLYYFAPSAAKPRLTLRPVSDPASPPLVEQELPLPRGAGIQRLELKSLGVTLTPGVEYRWTVSMAGEAREATGTIQRIEPSAELSRKLSATSGRSRYAMLARAGLWYDALDEVSRAVEAAPNNPLPAKHRAALLEQIGLNSIARYERQRYE